MTDMPKRAPVSPACSKEHAFCPHFPPCSEAGSSRPLTARRIPRCTLDLQPVDYKLVSSGSCSSHAPRHHG